MILSANENKNFCEYVYKISNNNPFACRIISLYDSYKPNLAFVDYWLITNDNEEYSGAIARVGTTFVLCLTDKTDVEEVSSFMRVAGASSILCDDKYKLDLFGGKSLSGAILMKSTAFSDVNEDVLLEEPDIKSVYELILKCSDEGFVPPPYDDFYVDVNHKLRHSAMRICGIYDGSKLVAAGMTVAESANGAILGAIACDPDYRKRGYASSVVKYLSNALIKENKTVYLHRGKNANVSFYDKLGFKEIGQWCEYNFGG